MRAFLRLPRRVAKALAQAGGYFWLPCPVCGRYHAGFEWDGRGLPYRDQPGAPYWTTELGYCSRHTGSELEAQGILFAEDMPHRQER